MLLTTPRPRGWGKRRIDRGGGATKRPRIESSSSDRRDESEEPRSRSGSTQGRPGRGGQQAARPMTPSRRPPPPSTSPRLTKDFWGLPLSAKSDTRRTAHSRSASEGERRWHGSRWSRSSLDQGRSGQASCLTLTSTTSSWYRKQVVPFSSPVRTLSSRDGCKWSRLIVGTVSGNHCAPTMPTRNRR